MRSAGMRRSWRSPTRWRALNLLRTIFSANISGEIMKKQLSWARVLIIVGICTPISQATFPELALRLPPESNAIVAVNVARLVESPYGKNAGWGQRLAESWEKQPLMIPPGAQRLLMAADV